MMAARDGMRLHGDELAPGINNYTMQFLFGGKIPCLNSAGIRIGGWDEAERSRRLWSRQ